MVADQSQGRSPYRPVDVGPFAITSPQESTEIGAKGVVQAPQVATPELSNTLAINEVHKNPDPTGEQGVREISPAVPVRTNSCYQIAACRRRATMWSDSEWPVPKIAAYQPNPGTAVSQAKPQAPAPQAPTADPLADLPENRPRRVPTRENRSARRPRPAKSLLCS